MLLVVPSREVLGVELLNRRDCQADRILIAASMALNSGDWAVRLGSILECFDFGFVLLGWFNQFIGTE